MSNPQIVRGSVDYFDVTVTSSLTLDTQPVAVTFDRVNYIAGTWQGAAGTTRVVRILTAANTFTRTGPHRVFVRVTDNPEIPLIDAGVIDVI